jgi:hypothetical protein
MSDLEGVSKTFVCGPVGAYALPRIVVGMWQSWRPICTGLADRARQIRSDLNASCFGALRRSTLSWCRPTHQINLHQINQQRSPIAATINDSRSTFSRFGLR